MKTYTKATSRELDDSTRFSQRRIVCAAMKNKAGDIICGPRHYDRLMFDQLKVSKGDWITGEIEQGFVDNKGIFLNRTEAFFVAHAANQIIRRCGGDFQKLFSENLY